MLRHIKQWIVKFWRGVKECNYYVIIFSSNILADILALYECSSQLSNNFVRGYFTIFKPFHQISESGNKNSGMNYINWITFPQNDSKQCTNAVKGLKKQQSIEQEICFQFIGASVSQDSIITCDVSKSDAFTQSKILRDNFSSFITFRFTKPVYVFWNTMVCNLKKEKKEEEVGPLKELFQLSQSSFCLKRCAIL